MKNLKMMMSAMLFFALISLGCTVANASGVGFINYKNVQDSYPAAQDAAKQIDAEGLKLQQYLIDKEKIYKTLDSPVKKKNFEDNTSKEFKVKETAYLNMKTKKEEQIYNEIQNAAKQVMIEQKLDAIVDFRIIFVGGIDVTDLVIQKLKSVK